MCNMGRWCEVIGRCGGVCGLGEGRGASEAIKIGAGMGRGITISHQTLVGITFILDYKKEVQNIFGNKLYSCSQIKWDTL